MTRRSTCPRTPRRSSSRRRSWATATSRSPRPTRAAPTLAGRRDARHRQHLGAARARPDLLQPQRPQRRARARRRQRERRPDRPPRGHGGQLRRPGRAVQRDDLQLQPAVADPRGQQGGAVRLRRRSSRSSSAPWPRTTRRSAAFNQSLSDVSTMLDGEKEELAAALKNLSVALGEVTTFVKDNKASLSRNIKGINRVAKVLVKQRAALEETLINAPLALNNLALTYNPQAGTLDTNANLGVARGQHRRPTRHWCSAPSSSPATRTGALCDAIRPDRPAGRRVQRRAPAPRATRSSTRRSAASWRWSDEADRDPPRPRRRRRRSSAASCSPAATSTSTSCRCPAAPTSATTR